MWQKLAWTFFCSRVSASSNLQNLNINLSRSREIEARKCANCRDANRLGRPWDPIFFAPDINCNPIKGSISSIKRLITMKPIGSRALLIFWTKALIKLVTEFENFVNKLKRESQIKSVFWRCNRC